MEVKEESLRTKNELEKETKERRAELQKYEKRVLSKEESVDKKADAVEKREAELQQKMLSVQKREKEVDELETKRSTGTGKNFRFYLRSGKRRITQKWKTM